MVEYLNSWSDDWRAMRESKEKDANPGPDVWVLTHAEMQQLKLHCEKASPQIGMSGLLLIYGIRIEEVVTKAEVRARVLELADKGVKAGLLADEMLP